MLEVREGGQVFAKEVTLVLGRFPAYAKYAANATGTSCAKLIKLTAAAKSSSGWRVLATSSTQ